MKKQAMAVVVAMFLVACGDGGTVYDTVGAPVVDGAEEVNMPSEKVPSATPDAAAPTLPAPTLPAPDAAPETPDAGSTPDAAPETPDAGSEPDAAPPPPPPPVDNCPGFQRVVVAAGTCVKAVNCAGFILVGGDDSIGAGGAAFAPGALAPAACVSNDQGICARYKHPSTSTPKSFDVFISPNTPASCVIKTYPMVNGFCPVAACP